MTMLGGIRRKKRREPAVRTDDLPEKVVLKEIDCEGEHMDLEIPIEATITLDENDIFIFNDEACVHGWV